MRISFGMMCAVACAAGCTGHGKGVIVGENRVDTLPGNQLVIFNGKPTAWSDTNGWKIVLERTIAPDAGSPGELGRVQSVVAGSNGDIYVLQDKPAVIKSYTGDGKWLRDIGREGDGPGEFHIGMFTIAGDVLVIQDPNHSRMSTFSIDGKPLASVTSQCCWWSGQFPVFSDTTVGITGSAPKGFEDREGAMYLTRLDGRVVDTILMEKRKPTDVSFGEGSWVVTRTIPGGKSSMGVDIPMHSRTAQAFLPNRQKVSGNTGSYSLAIMSLRNEVVRTFEAYSEPRKLSAHERDSLYEAAMNDLQEGWREEFRKVAKREHIPDTRPAWNDVVVDGASNIWVFRSGKTFGTEVFDVFNSDGFWLGTVPAIDGEGLLAGYWTTDHIYRLSQTEEGAPTIKVYRIEKGTSPR